MSEKVIQIKNLSKNFKDFWGRTKAKALDKVNFSIFRGEIFGLLGPNGSGKTTSLKLLLGLLFPTYGSIRILGKSPRHVSNKKYIGFLPEETYLYPYQNAEEALFFYGRLFGYPKSTCKKRVDDLLNMVGLNKARKRPLKEYSKGMARRIGIAQALINDPEIIFLDEPTTGLDPIGTKEIKSLIMQLKGHGKTILLCSHLLADVEDICDRIAILYGGKIRCLGNVNELLDNKKAAQLTMENASIDTLEELVSIIREKGINVSLDNPRQKLENFFLNVIQKARDSKLSTSGAEAGKTVQDFFSKYSVETKDKNQIIDKLLVPKSKDKDLVKPQSEIVQTQKTGETEEKEKKQKQVLNNLLINKSSTKGTQPQAKVQNHEKEQIEQEEKQKRKNNLLKKFLSKKVTHQKKGN